MYDLGGGTFDVSILKLHDGIFEVIATNGDTHLGGDDIDNLLIKIAIDDILGDANLDVSRNSEAVATIRKAVIEAKIALSSPPAKRPWISNFRKVSATSARLLGSNSSN